MSEEKIQMVPIDKVRPNEIQEKINVQTDSLTELVECIKKDGIIATPIVVVKSDECYTIVSGYRRWLASKMAEIKEVPVIILEK